MPWPRRATAARRQGRSEEWRTLFALRLTFAATKGSTRACAARLPPLGPARAIAHARGRHGRRRAAGRRWRGARSVVHDRRLARHLVHRRPRSRATSCSPPAHCVLPGADYKLVEFDAARQPMLQGRRSIARHPQFDLKRLLGHRATADVALIKLAAPFRRNSRRRRSAPRTRTVAVGDLRGRRLRPRRARRRPQRRHRARGDARRHRPARRAADPSVRSRDQRRRAPASAPAPAIPARRCSATPAAASPSSAW